MKLACVINPLLFVTEGVFPFFFYQLIYISLMPFPRKRSENVLLKSFFLLNSAYVVLGSELVFFLFVPALFLQIQEFEKLRNQIALT